MERMPHVSHEEESEAEECHEANLNYLEERMCSGGFQSPQRMEPGMSFRTDYSPIDENFLTNRDDQRINSSRGNSFLWGNGVATTESKLTINWGTLQR